MTNFAIDNTDDGDFNRSIIWQYDNAERLVGVIHAFADFFKAAVTDFWDDLIRQEAIGYDTDPATCSDFGLAVWGKILQVGRPMLSITDNGTETQRMLSAGLYRKVLVARFRLVNGNATIPDFIEYVKYVFDGKVSVVDQGTMSLAFEVKDGATLTAEESALLNQCADSLFAFPSGVRSDELATDKVFGFSEQTEGASASDPEIGGLDDCGFNWRTAKSLLAITATAVVTIPSDCRFVVEDQDSGDEIIYRLKRSGFDMASGDTAETEMLRQDDASGMWLQARLDAGLSVTLETYDEDEEEWISVSGVTATTILKWR